MICNPCQILVRWDEWNMWGRREVCTGFWWGEGETDHLKTSALIGG
jgi:hypothetical protein